VGKDAKTKGNSCTPSRAQRGERATATGDEAFLVRAVEYTGDA